MYRLLIVDEKESCEALCTQMDWTELGFETVVTAGSYAEAVDKALNVQPHVALVSVDLDGHKGATLIQHLYSVGQKTVFCMMARQKNMQDIRSAMRAGARDFLLKPIETEQLQEFLEWAVVNELHGELPERNAVSPQSDPVLQVEYASLSKITNKILLMVRNDYRHSLSLMGIAESLNMSSKYIGRIFLKDTGMRFTEYLMAYRMLEAKKLILGTGEKISVIAGMVGYSQLNNFYTHFRNYFGVSPSSLRNFDAAPEM